MCSAFDNLVFLHHDP